MFQEYGHMHNYNHRKHYSNHDCEFVALEKIHGTNYSFLTDGVEVFPCNRSRNLENDRTYYGHGESFIKYKNDVILIFEYLKQRIENLRHIQLYCELFGGNYKGFTKKGYICVQKNVNYTEILNFR